jgi:hypothetical protein
VHQKQPRGVDAQRLQRGRTRLRRRVEPHQAAPGAAHRRQRRREQAQLADAGVRQQQLGQRARRPAATRQLGVERGKAGGQRVVATPAELVRTPQRRVQRLGPGDRHATPRRHRRGGGTQCSDGRVNHRKTVYLYSLLDEPKA